MIDGCLVTLTDAEVARANSYARSCLDNVPQTPNYTGLTVPSRFKVGYAGEIATANALEHHGLRGLFKVRTNGEPQPAEITLYRHGQPVTVDVKCAGFVHDPQYLLISVKQFMRKPSAADWYLGAVMTRRGAIDEQPRAAGPCIIEMGGWLHRHDVPNLPVREFHPGTPSFYADYDKLPGFESLLGGFDVGPFKRDLPKGRLQAAEKGEILPPHRTPAPGIPDAKTQILTAKPPGYWLKWM